MSCRSELIPRAEVEAILTKYADQCKSTRDGRLKAGAVSSVALKVMAIPAIGTCATCHYWDPYWFTLDCPYGVCHSQAYKSGGVEIQVKPDHFCAAYKRREQTPKEDAR